ncbi:hypothetical protein F4861DRAFT_390124 [Xylaria intraflava]|nr:hypothetical protein F4861DRAFT_390124 [Xylaria intraflava]
MISIPTVFLQRSAMQQRFETRNVPAPMHPGETGRECRRPKRPTAHQLTSYAGSYASRQAIHHLRAITSASECDFTTVGIAVIYAGPLPHFLRMRIGMIRRRAISPASMIAGIAGLASWQSLTEAPDRPTEEDTDPNLPFSGIGTFQTELSRQRSPYTRPIAPEGDIDVCTGHLDLFPDPSNWSSSQTRSPMTAGWILDIPPAVITGPTS